MRISIFLLIICLLSSCNTSKEEKKEVVESFTQKDRERVIAEVKQTLDDYFESVRTKGLTGEFSYLDSSADFYWVPPGFEHPISFDSVASILRSRASSFKKIDNSFDTLIVVPLSNDIASYSGTVNSICTDTSGVKTGYKLTETGILVKRESGWKLLSGQTSLLATISGLKK